MDITVYVLCDVAPLDCIPENNDLSLMMIMKVLIPLGVCYQVMIRQQRCQKERRRRRMVVMIVAAVVSKASGNISIIEEGVRMSTWSFTGSTKGKRRN